MNKLSTSVKKQLLLKAQKYLKNSQVQIKPQWKKVDVQNFLNTKKSRQQQTTVACDHFDKKLEEYKITPHDNTTKAIKLYLEKIVTLNSSQPKKITNTMLGSLL